MRMITKVQIKALLARNDWNQTDLANACNVSQGTVSRWLKGTLPDPPAQTILKKLIDDEPPTDKPMAPEITNEITIEALLDAFDGTLRMLDFDEDEAAALVGIAVRVAREQPTPSAGKEFYRVLAETSVRQFLKSKRFQHDSA